jgi:hypothetical protein
MAAGAIDFHVGRPSLRLILADAFFFAINCFVAMAWIIAIAVMAAIGDRPAVPHLQIPFPNHFVLHAVIGAANQWVSPCLLKAQRLLESLTGPQP